MIYSEAEVASISAKIQTNPTNEYDIRYLRDILLDQTDWWAVSDNTMTAEQTAYRQALRDITDQAGFPEDVTWPTKPS